MKKWLFYKSRPVKERWLTLQSSTKRPTSDKSPPHHYKSPRSCAERNRPRIYSTEVVFDSPVSGDLSTVPLV